MDLLREGMCLRSLSALYGRLSQGPYWGDEDILEDTFLLGRNVNKPTAHCGERVEGGNFSLSPFLFLTCEVVRGVERQVIKYWITQPVRCRREMTMRASMLDSLRARKWPRSRIRTTCDLIKDSMNKLLYVKLFWLQA